MKFFGNSKYICKVNESNNLTQHVKIGSMITDGFRVGNGLKQADGLATNLFNIALKYVIRLLSVQVKFTTRGADNSLARPTSRCIC